MKSLTGLWISVTRECAEISGVCADQDISHALARFKDEGLSFFTITLPSFGSDFDKALSVGMVDSSLFIGFGRKGGLPRFLSGFLRRIFVPSTGVLLDSPCLDSIRSVRQICNLLKKVELECTVERQSQAIKRYVNVEEELRDLDLLYPWTADDYSEFSDMAIKVFGLELTTVDQMIYNGDIFPGHGPGNVSDRLRGNQKWYLPYWTERLDRLFPYVDFGIPNHRYWKESVPVFLAPEEEPPVKVTLVPKTLKTPRVIAQEPTHMQYMQQGLLQALVTTLESGDSDSSFVGFSNQEVSRSLARKGSMDGSIATIDLSDASDRVSNSLVDQGLCKRFPWLRMALSVTRSRRAILPDGRIVNLTKFASMGSAVCFPIEALVFSTIAFLGIQRQLGRVLTSRDVNSLRGRLRVYGDDIAVPTEYAFAVCRELERFRLVVNLNKSFWNGKFRESCGADYYDGEWVTPIRVTTVAPTTRKDAAELHSWVSLSNSLHKAGYWKSAAFAAGVLEGIFGELPVIPEQSGAVGLTSFCGVDLDSAKWDNHLHVPLVKALFVKSKAPSSKINGIPALHKCLRYDWSDPVYRQHLLRSGRPTTFYVRRGWVRAV